MFVCTAALHTFMILNAVAILIGRILFLHTLSLIFRMESLLFG